MRVLVVLATTALLGAAPASVQRAAPMPVQSPYADERCPDTAMSLARKQGANPRARNLAELPPAQTFMAVDRRVDGCPMPLLAGEARR
ncbi:hypothetical protein [Sphingomonas sp. LHG3406-1]|uniref:hypothetical protein n=1 Tax=Sphingomonas sp. LHG3406-1 TaxID=2804617 RepID=UPI0026055B00|nr:hypothetical protein [Sphingomonas sp. LHG3406-1]